MKIRLKCGMQAIHLDDLARYSRKLKAKSSEHKMSLYNCNGNYIIQNYECVWKWLIQLYVLQSISSIYQIL